MSRTGKSLVPVTPVVENAPSTGDNIQRIPLSSLSMIMRLVEDIKSLEKTAAAVQEVNIVGIQFKTASGDILSVAHNGNSRSYALNNFTLDDKLVAILQDSLRAYFYMEIEPLKAKLTEMGIDIDS